MLGPKRTPIFWEALTALFKENLGISVLRIQYWSLLLGVILLINAVVIFVNADGHVEGYVSSVICLLAGTLNVIYAFWRRSAKQNLSASHRD
ncbi:hypothetical protein [Microbacterium hominis]|uniref:Uncharacterized protein n=1 Tax=Microbacterium hominis TaxID=162426 RepID=A0A0B4DSX1_9MICO|nr:hypothetical protein [Microbacterium hominis]KIC57348.1 hypothetical protein RM52_09995 [Microbacterium hominis]